MKRLVLCLGLLPSVAFALGEPWGLCPGYPVTGMIPCDAGCFGSAAAGLGMEWVTKEVELDSQYIENSSKWVDFNNSYLDYVSQFSSDKSDAKDAYIKALDGLAKKVTAAIDGTAITNTKNVDNIATNYALIKSNGAKAELTLENIRQFNSPYGSFSGEWLLKNIDNYRQNPNVQKELYVPLVMTAAPNFNLSELEKGLSLAKDSDSSAAGRLLSQEQLTEEDFSKLSNTLSTLFVDNNINKNSISSRISKIKQQMALKLLLDTLYLKSNESEVSEYRSDIPQMVLAADESGTMKMAQSHALNEEIIYSQEISNSLLYQYLNLKRAKNAVVAFNNM